MNLLGFSIEELMSLTNVHPMIVHFPIVLLFVFLSLYLASFFTQKMSSQVCNLLILVSLIVFGLISKDTGEDAGIEVGPTLTNPRALTNHAEHALNFLWSVAFLLVVFVVVEFFLIKKNLVPPRVNIFLKGIVIVFGLASVLMVTKAGHTGATLVYKYAAGVDVPVRRAEKIIKIHEKSNNNK